MSDCMIFPEDWHDFLKDYSFDDSEEVYTNGSRLIQVYRVEQLIEHLLEAQTPHMMTLEEAADSQAPMWFEKTGDECGWITGIDCSPIQASTIGQVDGDDWYNLPTADYGRLWRCWSSQPTEEQRKAAAWHEA